MSANDILDVLNIQRDEDSQPPKKKQKAQNVQTGQRQSGMSRELFNLLGPNTPPVALSNASSANLFKDKPNAKPSPWTKMPFTPTSDPNLKFYHWVRGSKDLLESDNSPYFFDKFNVKLDIPELGDHEIYYKIMEEIKREESSVDEDGKKGKVHDKVDITGKTGEEQDGREQKNSSEDAASKSKKDGPNEAIDRQGLEKEDSEKQDTENEGSEKQNTEREGSEKEGSEKQDTEKQGIEKQNSEGGETSDNMGKKETETRSDISNPEKNESGHVSADDKEVDDYSWSYEETEHLFDLCKTFELKWPVIYDRFLYPDRSLEDIKEQFYRVSLKLLDYKPNVNPNLVEALLSYSKSKEVSRKQYLENLLKRTPAEIAEEESLIIEARRFELAAKKMLIERSHILSLLDSPQSTQSVQQYQSSNGLATLYNNLMLIEKHQKKRQHQPYKNASSQSIEPLPPSIPTAASSSIKRDRGFQTHLQQYLISYLKQNTSYNPKEPNPVHQLLSKRLTSKEEEAYGLYYHSNEKLTPGVILRSSQRLPGLQQRQSVLKSVGSILEELDIPTSGGNNFKPIMPTRKTMNKYDELLRAVATLLEVKKAKDKLEAETHLLKSQRDLQ